MRLKQTGALLLASAMIVGSVGIMNPTEVRAAGETNTFTLTVPADTSITQSGWNDIGNVGVSNVSIGADKKISVTIENGATGRTLKKTGDASKTVGYEVKKGTSASNEAFGTSLEFEANGTQAIGADVADFSTAEVGTYEDTINFTAALASAAQVVEYTLTGEKANNKKLTSTALLASTSQTTFTYDGTTYTAYNGYISETSGANWNDGVAFVEALNATEIDGRTGGWTLLTSKEMAYAWWLTTASADNMGASSFGAVSQVWTGGELGDLGDCADCSVAASYAYNGFAADMVQNLLWQPIGKTDSYPDSGFVVLRGSSKLADVMTTGAKCKLSVWQTVEGKMMEFKYEKKDTGFEVVDVTLGDESIKSSFGSMCISQVVDTHTIKLGITDNFDLTINVSNGTYTFRDAGFGMFEYRSFAVQPAGETEFTDITLTPAS